MLTIFCLALLGNTNIYAEEFNNTTSENTTLIQNTTTTESTNLTEDLNESQNTKNITTEKDNETTKQSNESLQTVENTTNTTNNTSENTSNATNSSENSTNAAGENEYTNIHGIWVKAEDALNLNVTDLLNQGITDIYVKCNIYSTPTYNTILAQVVNLFKNSGIRVNAWVTCFVDANGNWVNPAGDTYNYTVTVAKQVASTTWYKSWYKSWYQKWYKSWYKSKGKWKYTWKYVWKYVWKYGWQSKTVYNTVYTTETRTGVNTTHNSEVINAITDMVKNYGVNGINLDYVRYPGTAYKYANATETITSFVQTVYNTVKGINAKVAVSADLMPEKSVNAYYYGQDYEQLSNYLDYLVPMVYKGNYKEDTDWIGNVTAYIVNHSGGKPVIVGLQTYESDDNVTPIPGAELNGDVKEALDNGASGYSLFRYGLIDGIVSQSSVNSTVDSTSDNSGTNSSNSQDSTQNSTSGYSTISIAEIEDAANRVKTYIETNHRLPNYVTISSKQIQMPEFLNLLINALLNINNGNNNSVIDKTFQSSSSSSENVTSGNIYKDEYINLAKSIKAYMDSNNGTPNYVSSSLGNIGYESLVYMYSRIDNYIGQNGTLPNYASITPWTTVTSNTTTTSTIPAELQQYLAATANCQVTNSAIQSLAASLASSKTSTYDKAVAIFNWVRDNIGYSFYYNTKYGAVGTLNAKTGNCVDTAHLVVALERAAGIPARYEHVYAKFSSGSWYGHVIAQVWVNGVWYNADATSSRNTFGVVNNWNTATATIYGTYASLPF
ncbi:MAG TPA: pseudomurein-binding repeat-containing protein [Methanobacterium sp.]|nr:pseudomurein-binding repeat-containing protein [Methanobacterium sp.]